MKALPIRSAFAALACGVVCGTLADLRADVIDTVWNAQRARAEREKPANAARVRALGAKGDVAFFSVPAMSDVMRLDDTWPTDGVYGGTVRCVLAQDEFESCSFEFLIYFILSYFLRV